MAQQSTITGTLDGQPLIDDEIVNFVPGPASGGMTTIDAAPDSIVADGATTATVTVQAVDVNENLLTSGGDAVILATTSRSLGTVTDVRDGTYTAELTSSTTAGIATVTGTVNGAAIGDDASIVLIAGPPARLAIATQPSGSAQNGVVFGQPPIVQLQDAFGNDAAQFGLNVVVTIASGGGTLGGTTPVTTDASGLARFTDLAITGTAGDRTLQFTSGALTPATSDPITITPGVASQLAIVTQPSASAQSGVAFAAQPAVRLQDVSGNNVSQSGVSVGAAIASGGGTLGGTTPIATNGSGIATFAGLSITGLIGDRTLDFTSTSLTSVTSTTINVTAGPATQLVMVTEPSASAQNGVAFATQPAVRLRDSAGNDVSQLAVSVGTAIASGGGTLGGTTPITTNGSGVATFAGLSITGTIGNRTLQFTSGGLTSVTSTTINVTPGGATQIVLDGPLSVEELQTSTDFTIMVQDVSANTTTVTQATDFTLSSTSATPTFTPVSPVTVSIGTSSTTFTYSDATVGTPTVTATWASGGADLGSDAHVISVTAAPE